MTESNTLVDVDELRSEVSKKYQEVALDFGGSCHFCTGRPRPMSVLAVEVSDHGRVYLVYRNADSLEAGDQLEAVGQLGCLGFEC